MVKNLPANAGDVRDEGLIPGLGRSPGGGNGNPLHSCLGNPTDRGAWWATVHRVVQSQIRLKQLSMQAHIQGGKTKIFCLSNISGGLVKTLFFFYSRRKVMLFGFFLFVCLLLLLFNIY